MALVHCLMMLWCTSSYRYASLSPEDVPDTESLATTLERVLPYWNKVICPDIKDNKKVLVCAFSKLYISSIVIY